MPSTQPDPRDRVRPSPRRAVTRRPNPATTRMISGSANGSVTTAGLAQPDRRGQLPLRRAGSSRPVSSRSLDGWLTPADTATRDLRPSLLQPGVRRRLRHLRGAADGELLAQHRYHLAAEQVQLLQHGLERQAGMVDEEQLALVVTDVLAEGQGTVDQLLRATHRQRGLCGVLLKRRPVPVHRGVVEVRPEVPYRVLRVAP